MRRFGGETNGRRGSSREGGRRNGGELDRDRPETPKFGGLNIERKEAKPQPKLSQEINTKKRTGQKELDQSRTTFIELLKGRRCSGKFKTGKGNIIDCNGTVCTSEIGDNGEEIFRCVNCGNEIEIPPEENKK